MSDFIIEAQVRNDLGKGASRRLRREEKVPAVIYGGEQDPVSLTLSHSAMLKGLESEAFYSSVLTVKIDGKAEKAILRDLQRHAFKPKLLHVDFQRVSEKEKLHMQVPLHFIGEETAPGVKAGGMVQHIMNDVEVSCLAKDLPEFIEVDVSGLELEGVIHISDLKLPAGVESVALSHGEDHDLPVVAIHKTRGGSADDAGAEAEGGEEGGEA